MKLLKVHGSSNTFYLFEALYDNEVNYVQLTKWLCDKSNEGGADGLLLVLPSQIADAKMRVINADGSEASMCGNGLRCVARYVCEKLGVEEAVIETMRANLHVKKAQSIFEELPTYAVEISPVSFDLNTLPMHYDDKNQIRHENLAKFSDDILFTAVSVPNPHLVGIVQSSHIMDTTHQQQLASYLNGKNEICPDGVNVSYVYPISEHEIFVRTYERGVGFTNACGTAMTASALIANVENYVSTEVVTVYNPGGFVQCSVKMCENQYELLLIGNATIIGYYEVESKADKFEFINCFLTKEPLQYEKCNIYVKEKLGQYI
ncbi:diaminopimelate epimerase [Solibacillus daqui]|uniref:diaminopimelate epimerase n=1 Tax=Solibacillus daqui TaxID=2912187 RepID=UPI002366F1EE|nr:diaminopimelate epimerase [Solibacillus daqui]